MIDVIQANTTHLEQAAMLFNAYRIFYGQPDNLEGATAFIQERLDKQDSIFFLAFLAGTEVGFTHLFPSFTSVGMGRIWVLNDLFVIPSARKSGVGDALLSRAKALAKETASKRVILETAIDNYPAQKLYDKTGFIRVEGFYQYSFEL
ncbi:MAG: GNAT family N-acetyltransferase [Bacteroidota bacterium]